MLQDKPKKQKDYAHPTKGQLFWRIQKQCARRSVAVFLMYMFMSMIMLALQAIDNQTTTALEIVLGIICILGGCFYNGHLCYHCGKDHFDHYLMGCMRRKNEAYGIESGGEHRPEREYRIWKGFLIGFYVGLLVLVFGCLAGAFGDTYGGKYAIIVLSLFAGWAIIPLTWVKDLKGLTTVSLYWSVLFVLIPIVVSGVFYIVGAMREKSIKEAEAERQRKVKEAAEEAKERTRVQTEEQRRKTLQSKKKK